MLSPPKTVKTQTDAWVGASDLDVSFLVVLEIGLSTMMITSLRKVSLYELFTG